MNAPFTYRLHAAHTASAVWTTQDRHDDDDGAKSRIMRAWGSLPDGLGGSGRLLLLLLLLLAVLALVVLLVVLAGLLVVRALRHRRRRRRRGRGRLRRRCRC